MNSKLLQYNAVCVNQELCDETVHALEADDTSYIMRFVKDAIAHSKHVLVF